MAANRLRIIAGQWRGRRLSFPDSGGLRPTAERVRETLFNWLRSAVAGSRCLDLFAGSGALGLEAASRGATEVVCVERSGRTAAALRENVALLGAGERVRVIRADARRFLEGAGAPFDIVFLDPPFNSAIIGAASAALERNGWLVPGAWIYVESDRHGTAPALPPEWICRRHGVAGGVDYRLYRRETKELER
ncbi:16S rRNA (guanine(966)-N(2))-methyltransferase RsmD [Arhodomonas sp. SL1]|uniref:16S rRNA (guanine(966)-N(2))-methyltransferase RsmD n=1 Tax=Arhodomonas sp. SL1 TaxID=3425691 RepID=UPI003F8838EF